MGWEEAARRRQTALDGMRKVASQRPGNVSSCWKRLPQFCHSMREELCRSILSNFLEALHKELQLPSNKTPLNGFEEKTIASIIETKDVVELVKHLAETELHIRL